MRNIFSDSFANSVASKAFRDVLEFGCPHGVFLRESSMYSIALKNQDHIEMISIPADNHKEKLKSAIEVGRVVQKGIRLEWIWNLDFASAPPDNPFEVMTKSYYKTPRIAGNLLLEEQIYLELLLKIGFLLSKKFDEFQDNLANGAFYVAPNFNLPKTIDMHVFKIGVNAMDRLSTAMNIAKSCFNTLCQSGRQQSENIENSIHLLDLHEHDLIELSSEHSQFLKKNTL